MATGVDLTPINKTRCLMPNKVNSGLGYGTGFGSGSPFDKKFGHCSGYGYGFGIGHGSNRRFGYGAGESAGQGCKYGSGRGVGDDDDGSRSGDGSSICSGDGSGFDGRPPT